MQQRAAEGGHGVPADKVRARYQRSVELLPAAAEIADRTYVYDNTEAPSQKAEIENREITFISQNAPEWVQNTVDKLESRSNDRQAIANANQLPVNSANIDSGKYVGTINQITNNYIVQETGNELTIHDRGIVKADFNPGENTRIAYKDGNVAASLRPTRENMEWAQEIYNTVSQIFQREEDKQKITVPSRGIRLAQGSQYNIETNDNSKTLTVSSKDNRTVASYDLEEQSVIASNPTALDKQKWQELLSRVQSNIEPTNENQTEIND